MHQRHIQVRNKKITPLRIVGGGLAGASAAGCLARLPNVHVDVYERSEAIREVGALIGVMVSGMLR
jgi:2-polyprenyl-6-methoxyphenol hydroxylase-like FAD-dependent oxidoreductase